MKESHLPVEIYQVAKLNRLGAPIACYETIPKTIRHYKFSLYTMIIVAWIGLFGILSTILIVNATFFGISPRLDPRYIVGWPVLWIVVIWWLLSSDIRVTFQKTWLYVCELGLLGYNEQDKSTIVILWNRIESVWLHITPVYTTPASGETTKHYDWKYIFQLVDGKKFTFKGHSGILALSYVVDREITARLLPKAIATYEAGQPVIFGNIQVSRKGIQVSQDAIPWQNVLALESEGDQILVRLPDWEHWIGTAKAETPNVCVLRTLIGHINRKEGKEADN